MTLKDYLAFYFIRVVAAFLSFACSAYLLAFPIRRSYHQNRATGRDDILVGITALDLLSSFGLAFAIFPCPASDGKAFCHGNEDTCKAQGFLVQLGVSVPIYYLALSVFFLLSVCCNVPTRKLRRTMIPVVHVVAVLFSVGSAIAALQADLFNTNGGSLGCWIKSDDNKTLEHLFRIMFMLGPYLVGFSGTAVSMVILYRNVLKTEQRAMRWNARRWANVAEFSGRTSSSSEVVADEPGAISVQVRERGMLYVSVLWICFLPTLLLTIPGSFPRAFNWKFEGPYYNTLLVLNSALMPSHGTLNLLVYTRTHWVPRVQSFLQSTAEFFRQRRKAGDEDEASSGVEVISIASGT